jgi:hypothetical protein
MVTIMVLLYTNTYLNIHQYRIRVQTALDIVYPRIGDSPVPTLSVFGLMPFSKGTRSL